MRRTFLTLGESADMRGMIIWTNGEEQDAARFALGAGTG